MLLRHLGNVCDLRGDRPKPLRARSAYGRRTGPHETHGSLFLSMDGVEAGTAYHVRIAVGSSGQSYGQSALTRLGCRRGTISAMRVRSATSMSIT